EPIVDVIVGPGFRRRAAGEAGGQDGHIGAGLELRVGDPGAVVELVPYVRWCGAERADARLTPGRAEHRDHLARGHFAGDRIALLEAQGAGAAPAGAAA